jgi:putative transposase
VSAERGKQFITGFLKLEWELIIENLGLKPRRSTTALPLNTSAFTKYMLKCETWKKPFRFDFTPHPNKSRCRNLNREVWESPSVYGGEDVKL